MSEVGSRRDAPGQRGRPFLNTPQAAYYLGLSARHLERMRAKDEGPRYRRHGRFVFYHIDDIEAWSRSTGSDHNQWTECGDG